MIRPRTTALTYLCLASAIGGCTASPALPVEDRRGSLVDWPQPEVRLGLSLDDLRHLITVAHEPRGDDSRLLHHFTVHADDATTQCVSGALFGRTYFFVMRDGALDTVVPQEREWVPTHLAKQIDPFRLATELLDESGIDAGEWQRLVEADRARALETAQSREPLFVLNAFPKQTRRQAAERQRFEQLQSQLDGTGIQIGADAELVRSRFGAPRFTLPVGERGNIRAFGQDAKVGAWATPWVFVEVRDNSVRAVHTWWVADMARLDHAAPTP